MYKEDLALNILQWSVCEKNKPNLKSIILKFNEMSQYSNKRFTRLKNVLAINAWCVQVQSIIVTNRIYKKIGKTLAR